MRKTKDFTDALVCVLGFALAACARGADDGVVTIADGGVSLSIDTATLAADVWIGNGVSFLLSGPSGSFQTRIEARDDRSVTVGIPSLGLHLRFDVKDLVVRYSVSADRPCSFVWPRIPFEASDGLIWPLGDGRFIPMNSATWLGYLGGPHDVANDFDLPVWGIAGADRTRAWICESPFNTSLSFGDGEISVDQTFLNREGPEEHRYRMGVADRVAPLLPADVYRAFLIETGAFVTAEEKLRQVDPRARNRLAGAVNVYLWGDAILSVRDVIPGLWGDFARSLLSDSDLGPTLLASMDEASLSALGELASAQWPYPWIERELVRGLSDAMRQVDPRTVYARFGRFLHPPATWGEGISVAMLDELAAAGIDRARICIDADVDASGFHALSTRADELGYLFGVYDSYHSIHPPSIAGTDSSWPTAQFDQALYDTGGIQRSDGSYYVGFQGVGRLLNPCAAWPYVQERVAGNLASLPMTYYFVDCDAAGEMYDDYNPAHPLTAAEAARERRRRLDWLRVEHGLVVGSEGCNAQVAPSILVAEGPLSPVFSWEDERFRDRNSEYYIGRSWPPEAPEINFKTIPLPRLIVERYFDPSTRIPLLERVFHDSVAITCHYGSDLFKYEGVASTLELLELLYLDAPLYNLNRDRLAEHAADIAANYRFFSPLHREYGFRELLGFRWLTDDRLVQETTFAGGLRVTANFRATEYRDGALAVGARSVVAELPSGGVVTFAADS